MPGVMLATRQWGEKMKTMPAAQCAHVAKVYPECGGEMAHYFSCSPEAVIYRQNEWGDDVPPCAIALTSGSTVVTSLTRWWRLPGRWGSPCVPARNRTMLT